MPHITTETYKGLLLSVKEPRPEELSLRQIHILFMGLGVYRDSTIGAHIKNMLTVGLLSAGSRAQMWKVNWLRVGVKALAKGQKKLEDE